jgi:hypothetical protein
MSEPYLSPRAKKLLQRQADVAIVYFGYCNVRLLGALQSDVALCQRIAMLEAWSNVRPLGALQSDVALSQRTESLSIAKIMLEA